MTVKEYAQQLIDGTPNHGLTIENYEANSVEFKETYDIMRNSNDEDEQGELFNALLDLLGFSYN